jgi:two-component system sensor histidine kinase UhpB
MAQRGDPKEPEAVQVPSVSGRAVLSEIAGWPVRDELFREFRITDGAGRGPRYRRLSLYARVLTINVAVLIVACAVLAFTPATVHFPIGVEEGAVLAVGLLVMVVANAALLRVSFGPLAELVRRMRTIDLLMPGQRIPIEGGFEVRAVIAGFNEMLARLEEERRRSSSRALRVQDEERRRIGQELHDEIGQRLTAILLELKRALREAPEEIRPHLQEAQEATRATIDEVGQLAWQLRPGVLDDLGLVSALDSLAGSFEDSSGLDVERTFPAVVPRLESDVELAIYRVAQEALTNAARHGHADRIRLTVEVEDGIVRLEVEDDGVGLPDGYSEDWGIRGMRERALLAQGHFEIRSRPGGGVRVTLEIPLAAG